MLVNFAGMNRDARHNLDRLHELTSTILDPDRPPHSLRESVIDVAALLTSFGRLPAAPDRELGSGHTLTGGGLAISPQMAAMCADDFARTVVFLRGLHNAIVDARAKTGDRPVRVLYAGCGPLGILALPLMSVLGTDEAQFTLLDIHTESTDSVAAILDALGLRRHVADLLTQDALEYHAPADAAPDIILLEMLRSILEHEPQVAVSRHLLGQAQDAVLIPERIDIDLELVDPANEFSTQVDGGQTVDRARKRTLVGTAFTVSRDAVLAWDDRDIDHVPGHSLVTPEHDRSANLAMLFTRIRVYRDHVLGDYDSGLTSPRVLRLDLVLAPGDPLNFYYRLGRDPGLVWAT